MDLIALEIYDYITLKLYVTFRANVIRYIDQADDSSGDSEGLRTATTDAQKLTVELKGQRMPGEPETSGIAASGNSARTSGGSAADM